MASGEDAGRSFQRRGREAFGPSCHDKAGHAAENVGRCLKDRLRHGDDKAGREALRMARLPVMLMWLGGFGRVMRAMMMMRPEQGDIMPVAGWNRHERMQPRWHQKRQHQHDKERPKAD